MGDFYMKTILNILGSGYVLSILALLSACGQKGDLYLPEEPNDLVYASVEGKGLTKALIRTARENDFEYKGKICTLII